MVRPFAAKGKKRKKAEKYDRDEDGGESTAPAKRPMVDNEPDEEPPKEDFQELEGIPIVPKDPNSANNAGVIFVLERASLEVAKVGKVGIVFRLLLWSFWSFPFFFFFFDAFYEV